MVETLVVLTVVVLGVSAGALLAEAIVLVPFWQSIEAPAYLAWYKLNAARLLRFFGPLEVGALLPLHLIRPESPHTLLANHIPDRARRSFTQVTSYSAGVVTLLSQAIMAGA